jgi:prepilin-type N-terminal cleavage/methylation domain-containing protein
MLKRRQGFTLIELLIVIVIIGILAAIAIPKFGKTREKAYFKAMMSDLRNLQGQQELYYANPANSYNYASDVADVVDFAPSQGVTVSIYEGTTQGWAATALHAALDATTQECGMYFGTAVGPSYTTTAGVVACSGE